MEQYNIVFDKYQDFELENIKPVYIVGISASNTTLGSDVSSEVRNSVDKLVSLFFSIKTELLQK